MILAPTGILHHLSEAALNLARVPLRACLVSNRVGLGGAKSASFTRRTASRELYLRGSFFSFRSVSAKESPQTGPPRTPERHKRGYPHLYQRGSEEDLGRRGLYGREVAQLVQ